MLSPEMYETFEFVGGGLAVSLVLTILAIVFYRNKYVTNITVVLVYTILISCIALSIYFGSFILLGLGVVSYFTYCGIISFFAR